MKDWYEEHVSWPLQRFFGRDDRAVKLHEMFSSLDILELYGSAVKVLNSVTYR